MATSPPTAKLRIPADLAPWFEARQKFRLSHATVQMARELGLNPKKFGKLANIDGQRWKAPLPEFIAHCYRRAHQREQPEQVRTLEQVIAHRAAKKAEQKEKKAQRRLEASLAAAPATEPQQPAAPTPGPHAGTGSSPPCP